METENQSTNQNENLPATVPNNPPNGIRPPKVKPNKTGRPTKLTPEVHDLIVSAVRAGNYMETAAAFAGVHKATLFAWLKRGATSKKNSAYVRFHDAVKKATAEAEVRDIQTILAAAETQWQAAAWHRERMNPDRWGRAARLDVRTESVRGEETDRPFKDKTDEEVLKILSGEETPDPTFLPSIPDDEEKDNDADTDPDTSTEGTVAG